MHYALSYSDRRVQAKLTGDWFHHCFRSKSVQRILLPNGLKCISVTTCNRVRLTVWQHMCEPCVYVCVCGILCTLLPGACRTHLTALLLYHYSLKWWWSPKEEFVFVDRGSPGSLHVSAAAFINKSPSVSTVRGPFCFSVILKLVSWGSPAPPPPLFFICDFEKGHLGVIWSTLWPAWQLGPEGYWCHQRGCELLWRWESDT